MAITRACIDRFRSNSAQSFSTWHPILWFKFKGSKFKVTAYVTGNTDSLQNLWVYLTYLTWALGVSTAMWRLLVGRRKYTRRPKTIFANQKKTKNPERLARCRSALEMQCFRNCTLSSSTFTAATGHSCVILVWCDNSSFMCVVRERCDGCVLVPCANVHTYVNGY